MDTNLKSTNAGIGNDFDSFEDEIPVRSAGGKFFVVAVATRGFDADSDADRTRKGGTKELGIKKLAPLPPVVVTTRGLVADSGADRTRKFLKAPFIFSAADEDEIRGKISNFTRPNASGGREFQISKEGEEGEEGKEGREGREDIKVREIERGKGNFGVNLDEIIQKKEEVERDVEEKIGKIMGEILNFKVSSLKKDQSLNDKFQNGEAGNTPLAPLSRGELGKGEEGGDENYGSLFPSLRGVRGVFMVERFKNLLRTRIKGARNNLKLWQALVKKERDGGMGFSDKEADDVIKIVSGIMNGEEGSPLSQRGGRGDFSEAGVGNIGLTAATRDRSASESMGDTSGLYRREIPLTPFGKGGTKEDLGIGRIGEAVDASESMDNASGDGASKNPPLPPFGKGGREETHFTRGELGKGGNKDVRNFYAVSRPAGESGKPKIEDIKYKTKLTGPVEEIAGLRIKDLRHLSDSPEKAVEIIKNKIDALEEESFAMRISGIKAWRTSEIYKAYLEMGRRAISEGMKIGEISNFKFQISKGEEGGNLTKDEFYAIMDLNKRLRF